MALSDILQFDCYVENGLARNTLEDFAELCGEIFEKYKKLWVENLKLQKHCENADCKLKSDNYNNKVVSSPDRSQLSSEIYTMSSSDKIIPTSSNSDTTSDLDDSILTDSAAVKEQTVDEKLLKSPILKKTYFKRKKINISNSPIILETSQNYVDNMKENECSIIGNNKNEIECTPVTKIPKRLGISTLHNIDTTLLQNGKTLRQSKLVLCQDEQFYQNMARNNRKYKNVTTPDKNIKKDLRKLDMSAEVIDDIIQDSPSKHTKSKLNKKSLRLKKKTSTKLIIKQNDGTKTDTINRLNHKSNDIKLAEKNMNESSLSQSFNPVYVSTQKGQSFLSRKSKALNSDDEDIKNNCNVLNSSILSKVAELEHSPFKNSDGFSNPVKKTKQLKMKEDDSKVGNIKCSQSISHSMLHTNSSICNDETFYDLGEQFKKESIYDTDTLKTSKKNIIKYNVLSESVKRSLTNSFDIVPQKKNKCYDKPSKKQSERAKMAGVSCWECKKYYDNLGLCEEEIEARQNQCSRHRTATRNVRESTPEGFWDPLFPETYTSTYQD